MTWWSVREEKQFKIQLWSVQRWTSTGPSSHLTQSRLKLGEPSLRSQLAILQTSPSLKAPSMELHLGATINTPKREGVVDVTFLEYQNKEANIELFKNADEILSQIEKLFPFVAGNGKFFSQHLNL